MNDPTCTDRQRMTAVRNVFITVTLAATIAAWLPAALVAQAAEPYTIVVTDSDARVAFRLSTAGEWQWCLPDTRDAGLEYSWTATVDNRGHSYAFGFFLFKCHHPGATNGRFDALVRAGQMGVSELEPGAGHFLTEMRVDLQTSPEGLTLIVNDAKTLLALFSDRPPHATLKMHRPGAPDVIREVAIRYARP
jgi:hypothetical protein